ncbi:MAG: thymidine phosphorylase [Acidobacteria bacterium]|nr:thymidine phosphorylase [Acidobacteriota bacterium]
MMRPQDIISKKRDGERLSEREINAFIDGVTHETWADYQITALIMAMFIHELDSDEQAAITKAMLYSGETLDLSDIDKPKADKHSTGGVGDKTSLIIAPLAASCGLAVPMISGRGLGHTGGTLDKLESIKGFNVNLPTAEFKKIIKKCGYAMSGQTAEIAPADKKIYALRDATATVPTIPLIVASIMSKKLAEGLDALVLDVKTGSGAFMTEFSDAERLAKALVDTGNSCGVKTKALITDMNQPLGKFVGNALEVIECIDLLKGETSQATDPTRKLAVELTAQMVAAAGLTNDIESARALALSKLTGGDAFETFCENIGLQGGDPAVCKNPADLMDSGLLEFQIRAETSGFVTKIETAGIGNAICMIGGGRLKAEDDIDHGVGYACEVGLGAEIRSGDVLGRLWCRTTDQSDEVKQTILSSYIIGEERGEDQLLIKQTIS